MPSQVRGSTRAGAARRSAALAVGCVAATTLALTGCGVGKPAVVGAVGNQTGAVQGMGVITAIPADKRVAAPALAGKDLSGAPLSLSSLRGKVVVLNVWASWCGPCNAEAPALEQVHQENNPKDVAFLGVDTRDTVANGLAFQRANKVSYPSLNDPDGMLLLAFRGQLSPQAIPSTLVIDRQGRVAVRALTSVTLTQLRQYLRPVVAEG